MTEIKLRIEKKRIRGGQPGKQKTKGQLESSRRVIFHVWKGKDRTLTYSNAYFV